MKAFNSQISVTSYDSSRRGFLLQSIKFGAGYVVASAFLPFGGCGREDVALPPFSKLDARTVVSELRSGRLSVADYCQGLLNLYKRHEELNAVIWIDEDRLLETAQKIDQRREKGIQLGRLAGLPLAIKDNINIAGIPTTTGTAALKDFAPKTTAKTVQSLFDQDALLFAKTNMHELAAGGTSSNPVFGSVRNPHHPTRIAGGSSGGTAAAIVAGFVPAGLGTDTAGSVRIPAALCGCTGFRPSMGTRERSSHWSAEGVVPLSDDLDIIGPMARSVSDIGLFNEALTGRLSPETSLKSVRLGIPTNHFWTNLDPEVRLVCEKVLQTIGEAGGVILEINLDEVISPALELFDLLAAASFGNDIADFLERHANAPTWNSVYAQIQSADVKALLRTFQDIKIPANVIQQARTEQRPQVIAAYEHKFRENNLDAIVYPTVPVPAPKISEEGDMPDDTLILNGKPVSKSLTLIRNTKIAPVLKTPSLTLNAGLTKSGLPVGFGLDGLPDKNEGLLAIGGAIERALKSNAI